MLPLDGYFESQDSNVTNFTDGLHYVIPQSEPFQYGKYFSITSSGAEMIKSMNLAAENMAGLESIMNQANFLQNQTVAPGQINLQSAIEKAKKAQLNAPAAPAPAPAPAPPQGGVGQGGRGKKQMKSRRVPKAKYNTGGRMNTTKTGYGKSTIGQTGRAEPGIPVHREEINLVGFLDGIDPAQRLRNQAYQYNAF